MRRHRQSAGITVSELLRRRAIIPEIRKPIETVICEYTGARIFKGDPSFVPPNTEPVKEMLANSMKYPLDVNALIAWGWKDHPLHDRTAIWLLDVITRPECLIYTSTSRNEIPGAERFSATPRCFCGR